VLKLFRIPISFGVVVLLLSEAVILLASFIFASYLTLGMDPRLYLVYESGWVQIGIVVASIVWTMYFLDLYTNVLVTSVVVLIHEVLTACGIAFVVEGLASYVRPDLRLPMRVLGIGCGIGGGLLVIWRVLYSRYLFRIIASRRVLFVGTNILIREIAEHIAEHPEAGIHVVGHLDDGVEADGQSSALGKRLGPLENLVDVVTSTKPERLIVGMSERRGQMPVAALLQIRLAGFFVEEAAAAYETLCGRISVAALRPSQIVFSGEFGPRRHSLLIHFLFDICAATSATLVLLPVIIAVAITLKFTRGPILYRQQRIGLNGKAFNVLKFRSMDENPDDPLNPRETRLGNFLRKSHLNELPQLFNVLRGEMSVVGPRPERPEFVKIFCEQIPFYARRHCVTPGITGWAQINYDHADSVADTVRKLEYDLYYIKYMSHTLDLMIMFQTIKIVLLGRGAG
jgi:exopolysaccharide biosynthesis polyprenyl glycosylphosphotransferase